MLIDISHEFYGVKASSDAVSSDGYEIENLLSANNLKKSQGFLAARFIKPPVHVLFELPFPFHVHSIVINPKVGGQCSANVDVLAASLSFKLAKGKTKPDCNGTDLQYDQQVTAHSAKNEHNNLFRLVGKGRTEDRKWMRFTNRFFQERPPTHNTDNGSACYANMQTFEMWSTNMLISVTHLLLRIPRMANSGIPALGKVEVWGQPSRNCPGHITNNALRIHQKLLNLKKISSGLKYQQTTSTKKHTGEEKHAEQVPNDSIPADFKDPLTCTLMTLPMLLPSGQNVDNSTLTKYNKNERSWGRKESDPFTGVPFSDGCGPVVNSNLKARIDKFLLSGKIDTSGLPRVLGSKERQSVPSQSVQSRTVSSCDQSDNGSLCDTKGDSRDFDTETGNEKGLSTESKLVRHALKQHVLGKQGRTTVADKIQANRSMSPVEDNPPTVSYAHGDTETCSTDTVPTANGTTEKSSPKDTYDQRANGVEEDAGILSDGVSNSTFGSVKDCSIKKRKCERILQKANKKQHVVPAPVSKPEKTTAVPTSAILRTSLSHEEDLSQSLNDELQRTLQGLPSYLKNTPRSANKTSLNKSVPGKTYQRVLGLEEKTTHCVSCDNDGQTHPLYSLPCAHLLCRSCVAKCRDTCCKCSKGFRKSAVVRVHVN